jgi:predicted LPLAT superfamily acyltransferase
MPAYGVGPAGTIRCPEVPISVAVDKPRPPVAWAARGEVGPLAVLRLSVWLARWLGRTASRMLLVPVCLGFLICRPDARNASKAYLARVLGRPPGVRDVLRHFFTFGTTVLDRIYLLNDEADRFEITIHGEEIVMDILAQGGGCLLFGAHHGSFEVLRLVGRKQPGLRVSLAMYEATGRKISAALNAINPHLAPLIIGLGTPGAMIEIRDCLEQGGFVGMLADRTLASDTTISIDFLGAPAAFPTGPARLAALLRPPVVLMVGLFRGANRYEIHFERLAGPTSARAEPEETTCLIADYVARLEHYCREAPYNWFNFFDFWA